MCGFRAFAAQTVAPRAGAEIIRQIFVGEWIEGVV
jgi:hypothetical protein